MAQNNFRGNLSAKAFPFLSYLFGQSVIINGFDQAENNYPQAYYMHNVVPTAQGYKSVGFKKVLESSGLSFDRVIPVRDPSMVRGWIGITSAGKVYIYCAGDLAWTDLTSIVGSWPYNRPVSVAYAGGYTYLCLAGYNVYKVGVAARTITPVSLAGLQVDKITAITSSANYLIVTDGVKVYWSSTITAEDFVPSQVTGAGSGTPADVEGTIVAMVPLSTGFAIYTSVNVVIASYSQNPRFPFVFRGADNSKGIADVQHITYGGDDGTNYAWTSAGIQKITISGAVTVLPEVTDFLAGREYEYWDVVNSAPVSVTTLTPLKVKMAFVGGRYLVVSYGDGALQYALVYDTALSRWGKLKINHVSVFDVDLNSDNSFTSSSSASAKKTLGVITADGDIYVCDFDNPTAASDSIIVLGKFQLSRSRMTTLDTITLENVSNDCAVKLVTTLDGKPSLITTPALTSTVGRTKEYKSRVTGLNHSIAVSGTFQLSSYELELHVNGRR
jgi:hypothetical protein